MILGSLGTPPLANHVRPAYLITGGLFLAGSGYTIPDLGAASVIEV